MNWILIVVSLTTWDGYMHCCQTATAVAMQEFTDLRACRAAADEIARQNNDHSTLRMSCVRKGTPTP